MVAGEGFAPNGTQSGVIVVNETLARQITKDGGLQSALGATLILAERPVTVIGIARDAWLTDVTEVSPMVFRAYDGVQIPTILVHSSDVAAQQTIKNLVNDLDSRIRVSVTPLQDNLDRKLGTARLASQLASGLGLFALLLAAVGLYGVFAFWVQQRAPEIAIRMALGATPDNVIGLVLRSSGRAVLIGAAIGLAGAILVASVLRARLYGLSPLDPIAFATAFGVLFVAAFASTFIPARRATMVNPISALRVD
jgi:ABC-type antimicrobial peptide transport system permease subunit